jgi:hypothetical protein
MKILGIIVVLAFLTIALFGFAGFNADHNTAFMSCIKTIAGDLSCTNSFAMGNMHANIYQGFSQGIAMVFLLLICMFSLAMITLTDTVNFSFFQNFELEVSDFRNKIITWFILQEKTDPLV